MKITSPRRNLRPTYSLSLWISFFDGVQIKNQLVYISIRRFIGTDMEKGDGEKAGFLNTRSISMGFKR